MAKLNWFLTLKNMSKSDPTAKELLNEINNAPSEEEKEKAKATAKDYVESFPEPLPEPEKEPEHIETVSEVEIAEKELEPEPASVEIEIDTETTEETGARPEPRPTMDMGLVERIRRRQRIAEENMRKRRNVAITLSEQKAAAIEKGKEVIKRNAEMAERRKALHEKIMAQQAERKAQDAKNYVGLLTILLREIKLRKRLELICKEHHISRADLDKLKETNKAGWAELLSERPVLEVEIERFIH